MLCPERRAGASKRGHGGPGERLWSNSRTDCGQLRPRKKRGTADMGVAEIVLVALGSGGLGAAINRWLDRRAQRNREEERALREVRTPLYRELLRPLAVSLAAVRQGKEPVQVLGGSADSPEYHLALFEFAITASDDLVRSFSKLMFAASMRVALPEAGKEHIEDLGKLQADFIFQLRRDLGPRKTSLEPDDLIRVLFPHSGNADISETLRETRTGSHGSSSTPSNS